jgi:hypothetical protein
MKKTRNLSHCPPQAAHYQDGSTSDNSKIMTVHIISLPVKSKLKSRDRLLAEFEQSHEIHQNESKVSKSVFPKNDSATVGEGFEGGDEKARARARERV